jgi:cyclic pyranopterin phosphate synthase
MDNKLIDAHGRVIDYLRVSITDLCNLRCVYCRPPEGVKLLKHDDIMRYEEILLVIDVARQLGIRKVRITGGEPLVRRGVVQFVAAVTALEGIEDVALTTNGSLLAPLAGKLKEAGLRRINISIDSLRRDVFKEITGRDELEAVMAGLEAARTVGFNPVKINVVLLKGINEGDIADFARITLDRDVDVRFIERMPFGPHSVDNPPDSFSASTALEIIRDAVGPYVKIKRDDLDGPARMYRLNGAKGRVGVIDPVTGHFCGTCNRLRLTAGGTLRPCLMAPAEIDIKSAVRAGASRDKLAEVIRTAVHSKPAHSKAVGCSESGVGMNQIGG